jgi:YVTN family beta-propeller protein
MSHRHWIYRALLVLLAVAPRAAATAPAIEVQQAVPTGSMPKGVTISPDGRHLFVTNYGQLNHDNVSVFDAETLRLEYRIDVPGIVVESAISPDGNTLYVSNFRRNSVQFVDLARREVTHEVTAGLHPKILVLSHDGSRLFAANWGSQDVTEIDTATATATRTLHAQLNPRGMAITQAGRLYIANFNSRSIDIYEGASMETHRRLENVCRIPRHLVLSPDETRLYVSCLTDSTLVVLDTQSERAIRRVPVGRSPKADDVTADGRYVVTADYGGSSVTIVDTTDWTRRTIEVPGMDAASGIVTARQGVRFFVTGWYDDHLYAVGLEGSGSRYAIDARTAVRTRESRANHRLHPAE